MRTGFSATLERALRNWILRVIKSRHLDEERLVVRCDLMEAGRDDSELDEAEQIAHLAPKAKLWDLVDAVLDLARPSSRPAGSTYDFLGQFERQRWVMEVRTPLQLILDDAGSIYTVHKSGLALERRMDLAAAVLLGDAVKSAEHPDRGSAARHLLQARDAAYARNPDAVKAYSEAIKAVEAAAHVTLQPNHGKATLGTMLGELRQIRRKLTVPIAGPGGTEGIAMVESLMETLWTGQTSRHGNLQVTRDETPAEAIAAVHIAALLVQLFASGAIRRTN